MSFCQYVDIAFSPIDQQPALMNVEGHVLYRHCQFEDMRVIVADDAPRFIECQFMGCEVRAESMDSFHGCSFGSGLPEPLHKPLSEYA